MKNIKLYIKEALKINSKSKVIKTNFKYFPETREELKKIIFDLINKQSKNDIINLNDIDTSKITDMFELFKSFEGLIKIDVSNWDVSNVKNMKAMFFGCISLKQIIGIEKWDVSNVCNMGFMFDGCKSFNQDISKWDVSNVDNMVFMFDGCKSFNQDISKWDVSNVLASINAFMHCPIEEKYKPNFKK